MARTNTVHASQEEHRNENDADANSRDECGQGDFLRAIENGLFERFADGHLAMDVFNFHRGVIHQNADGQSESPQGHQVDGFAQGA